MKLETGRPEFMEGRLQKEVRVYDLLEQLQIPYQRIDHPQVDNMEDCAKIDKLLEVVMCKNLFLRNSAGDQFYMLMMPAGKKFRTAEVSKEIGSTRLSFATEEYMEAYLDITPGSVSVMGLMNDTENKVKLLVDEDVLTQEYVGCHPCINTSSLRLRTRDVFETFLNEVHHDYTVVHLAG